MNPIAMLENLRDMAAAANVGLVTTEDVNRLEARIAELEELVDEIEDALDDREDASSEA